MLEIHLAATEDFPACRVELEHSLDSLSKWEAFYEKSYFSQEQLSPEETKKYFEFMICGPNRPENFMERLTVEQMTEIIKYLPRRNSATWFRETPSQNTREVLTTDLVYHWMLELDIPINPCSSWNINRLLIFIKVRSIKKTADQKKMNPKQQQAEYQRLNAERRAKYGSAG